MAALRNDEKSRAIDVTRHLLGKFSRRQLITVTDHYGGRASNAGKIGSRVGAGHIHLQMTDKGVRSAFHCHGPIGFSQYPVAVASRMDYQGELEVQAFAKPSRLRHRDTLPTALRLL